MRTVDRLPESIASFTIGEDRYLRGLVATNIPVEEGDLFFALEGKTFDDPFRLDADLLHINGFAKRTLPVAGGRLQASLLGYHAEWTSTDQIPRRALEAGLVSRLGFLDPDLGGETTRVGATIDWRQEAEDPLALSTYLIYYRFKLFSNFTYFLDDAREGMGAFTNSGREVDGLVSPKLSLAVRPHEHIELYLNGGGGFHSNDARGTTIDIDPVNGDAVDAVDPLARQWGAEFGARWQPSFRLHLTSTVWWLNSESELLFVGDAGTTEPQGSSRRYGVELTGFLRPVDWLAFDATYTRSWADFRSRPSGSDRIPGAIESVVSAGATVTAGSFSGSLRVRHFGAYPLIAENTQRAGGTTLLNLGTSYEWDFFRVNITVINLLDSKDSDIEYFFRSRLPGEPAAGVEDVHSHPVAPRQVRATFVARF